MKKLRDAVGRHPALTFVAGESQTIGGFGRNDRFEYQQRFTGTGDIRNRVLVEAGAASGKEPTERVRLQSYVGQFLQETGVSLGADDEGSFEMRLLHFRRTFVEKMFAIHGKVDAYQKTGREIGGYARHYYDRVRPQIDVPKSFRGLCLWCERLAEPSRNTPVGLIRNRFAA